MKSHFPRQIAAALSVACIASSVGCYPVYPPGGYHSAYNEDSKGYSVPQESAPRRQPVGYGVDPGLAIAGVAAAGILGYALGDHHSHHSYYGPRYYGPVPYGRGYYAPRYCR